MRLVISKGYDDATEVVDKVESWKLTDHETLWIETPTGAVAFSSMEWRRFEVIKEEGDQ